MVRFIGDEIWRSADPRLMLKFRLDSKSRRPILVGDCRIWPWATRPLFSKALIVQVVHFTKTSLHSKALLA